MEPPGKPHRLLPPATAMFSSPHQRLPTGMESVLSGTVRQTCGDIESGKSMLSGSRRLMTLPLISVISVACIVERHHGTAVRAATLAEGRSVTRGICGAPVLGPFQS